MVQIVLFFIDFIYFHVVALSIARDLCLMPVDVLSNIKVEIVHKQSWNCLGTWFMLHVSSMPNLES